MSFINSTRVRKIVRALMLVIPILVQCCVSVVAFIHQQWILLAMTIPALCAALYYIIDRSESKKQEAPQQNTEALSSSIEEEHQQIIPQALESLLFSNNNTHSLMWRNIVFKWLQQAKTIPLGTTIQGLYILDIHSKGPHALIAGTTGSGKSILLESWCLSYATSFSPEQLQFVFLDFKGGATFSALRKLPHCVGNVSDLNISHASRALRALELELQRRETIVAQHNVHNIQELPSHISVAKLHIVIDEYHALQEQLPDYMNRLVRIASLGRSLGMHMIICTQNPISQVGSSIKANMGLHICLRVRDSLQSQELLNSPCAANIPPSLPGAAYCHDGEIIRAFRTAACKQPQHVIRSTLYTARMMNIQPAPALFTEPLPRNISLPENNENNYNCILDNGTHTSHYNILDKAQNCMFIGNKQCGKTNALSILVSQSVQKGKRVRHSYYIEHKWIHREYNQPHANTTNQIMHEYSGNLNNTIQEVWCIDDVDNFSHMYDNKNIALADEILHALQNTQTQVILTCNNVPKQFLQYCDTTLVFPTGDYAQDCTNGISRTIFQNITLDATYPGRCVLIQQNKQYLIQFFKKMHVES